MSCQKQLLEALARHTQALNAHSAQLERFTEAVMQLAGGVHALADSLAVAVDESTTPSTGTDDVERYADGSPIGG